MKHNFLRKLIKKDNPFSVEVVGDYTDFSNNDNEFKFVFNDKSADNTKFQIITFGDLTKGLPNDSLTIYQNDRPITRLNLSYNYLTWDKKKVLKFYQFVAIGVSGFFYLYDLSVKRFILFLDFNGYFYDMKVTRDCLLVAYHSGIYCLSKFGQIKWHNFNVGLDGITIEDVKDGKVYGNEQVNPPDGWRNFTLDIETGFPIT